MNPKVRNNFAVVAVGALACSLSFAPVAMAATDSPSPSLPGASGDAYRIAGQSRFGTAIAASKVLRDTAVVTVPADAINATVILSNYLSWSDVLAATPLADELNAPVLYTYADRLEPATKAELVRLAGLGVRNVTLVGGELAINKSVVAELKAMNLQITADPTREFGVDRVGGTSRFDTALLLAAETVDYYNGSGSAVAVARKNIATYAQAEAEFAETLAALGVAQAKLTTATQTYNTATATVTAAEAALASITNGLVPSAPVGSVIVNADTTRPAVTVTSLTEFNSELAVYKYAAADATAISTFANTVAGRYVAASTAAMPKSDADNWQLLVDYFGAELFTIPLKAGPVTGNLAQITAAVGGDNGASIAVNKTALIDDKDAAVSQLATVQAQYDTYLAAYLASIAANTANNALQPQINAASAKLTAAKTVQTAAFVALGKAVTAESDAFDAFNDASALPSVSVKLAAQLAYDNALRAALQAGTAYPAFLATGLDFPDALAAGPAAAKSNGVVLLTNGATMAPATQKYLVSGPAVIAVGGPAASAAPTASAKFVGGSRYETATKLAAAYFPASQYVGLASGEVAADAVIGGALLANLDGTLVLTRQNLLPDTTASYLSYTVSAVDPDLLVFGGKLAISNDVRDDAVDALRN